MDCQSFGEGTARVKLELTDFSLNIKFKFKMIGHFKGSSKQTFTVKCYYVFDLEIVQILAFKSFQT